MFGDGGANIPGGVKVTTGMGGSLRPVGQLAERRGAIEPGNADSEQGCQRGEVEGFVDMCPPVCEGNGVTAGGNA